MAARHAGVTPVWASEIEPFPCSVTARHFPEVKQLGDITKWVMMRLVERGAENDKVCVEF